jgi:ABC-type amino acid transport substrate-binding protein
MTGFLRYFAVILTLIIIFGSGELYAQEQPLRGRSIIVGTKEAPPFAIKIDEATWKGISIDLWRRIAAELNLEYEFRELDLKGLLDGVANGSLDAAVAALTMTSEREKLLDFTHPFHTTGLGIAVASAQGSHWPTVLKKLFSGVFAKAVATLVALLLVVGLLVWWFERKRNPAQFGGGTAAGIGSGFWWSAVTMTTVGYGDKAPVTLGGRLVALIWMFVSLAIASVFIATITASFTVLQLESTVQGAEDLPKVLVGTLEHSTSESYLRDHRITFLVYRTAVEGLLALSEGSIEAFVYDEPMLRYLVNRDFKGDLEVLPGTFERQDYGIALQVGSPLREPINRVLLQKIVETEWQDTLYNYLGR